MQKKSLLPRRIVLALISRWYSVILAEIELEIIKGKGWRGNANWFGLPGLARSVDI